ncbi:hypothetical protein BDN67DRAFT_1048545, partial [Paxillus ammoniavirescens]
KVSPNSPTYPWPTKAHFLTTLLFNSPRLPFSDPQKKAILDWAKELGARDVPSLYALKQRQEQVKKIVGDPTEKIISPFGNVFYINDVAKAIAKASDQRLTQSVYKSNKCTFWTQDYANPLTRFAMQDFPEDGGNGMSQVFHGEKMLHELPSPPAVRVDGNIYYVDELLQDSSGGYFIPERFFLALPRVALGSSEGRADTKELFALGRAAERTEAGFIVRDEKEIIPTSVFKRSYEDIAFRHSELACGLTESSKKYASLEPNPWRKKSGGRMVYAVPLIIFMDDVSGNISKQWNKHYVIYMSNANLPREMLDKEFHVRFVTSSPHASPMELMHGMKQSILNAAESGIVTWDCRDNEEVMLIPRGLFHGGDNPMQAEECSQGGLTCNHFCRTCDVGGTKEHKESEEGYRSLFKSGNLRSPEGTVDEIKSQFVIAKLSGATEKVKTSLATTGVRDSLSLGILTTLVEMGKKLRKRDAGIPAMKESEVKAALEKELEDLLNGKNLDDVINPLLGMKDMNIHLDTPTEILHTILLGVVKYFWGQTVYLIEKAKLLDVFQSRLDSIDHDALNAPSLNPEYICRYKGGLIGKHFKSLAQVMPFVIHDLIPQTVMDGWTTLGELVVLLWHTKIVDVEVYLAQLSRTIEDFLNVTAICAPSILITKPKFHFLVHLPAYIRRFGPAIIFSTERYESFNHVFRLSCIYSSRQGPSQDTCRRFAQLDIVKHIVTGGYWYEQELRKWVCAGPFVLSFLSEHPAQGKLLGIKPNSDPCEANATSGKSKTQLSNAVQWETTACAKIPAAQLVQTHKQEYYQGDAFISRHGDKVKLNGNVIFKHPPSTSGFAIGRVVEILIDDAYRRAISYIALQLFTFGPALHPSLHLPCLDLSGEKVVVTSGDVICGVNLQHNCTDSKCTQLIHRTVRQERTVTRRTKPAIRHELTGKYFLNTYSVHNYAFIRTTLPSFLQESPLRVPTASVQKVRSNAAQQVRDKKAQRQSNQNPQQAT